MGLAKAAAAVVAAGAVCVTYGSLVESRWYRLQRAEVPILPAGRGPIRVLHVSDLHLLPSQSAKRDWVRSLAALEPDLVVNTGDNLSNQDSVEPAMHAFAGLLDRPGVFVFGSNDYYEPVLKSPLRYLRGRHAPRQPLQGELPWQDLRDGFEAGGWHDLTHQQTTLDLAGVRVELRGTDDAHLRRDDYASVAGPPSDDVDLSIGVTHAPYLRVLNAMAADRLDLIMAGHTHGGQVCVPFYGALTTNCDLDAKRVKGLSWHSHAGATSALHVSGGLGMSPYAPYRFACRPEATLLTLVPKA